MSSNSLQKLLKILSDGHYHSGEDISSTLNITRNAIWKLIKQLRELGLDIESKTNQSYRIPNGVELLAATNIKKYVKPAYHHLLNNMVIFDEIDSTNNFLLSERPAKTSLCLAETQTAGRGRFGRQWFSSFGKNIYFSMRWRFQCDMSELSGLSLAIGIAVISALKECGVTQAISLKWPNDVIFESKKLCGTLIELHGESNHQANAVIGIGINLAMPESASSYIDQAWTDLTQITGNKIERNKLVALLINNLTKTITIFEQQGLKPFIKTWQQLDRYYRKPIRIILGKETIKGINQGIDESGRLLLKDPNGKLHAFSCGEVSLRS